nr:integrase, catalytic region, zinc finger, CCHC-type, peptidase aspartic, catalytic [Tanacetum cinerariifolium]
MTDLKEEYQARDLLAKSKVSSKKHEEEVSSDDNEVTEVKALMPLADEERVSVGQESARNANKFPLKRKNLGIDQPTEDTLSSGPKDLIFVTSSVDNVSITDSNKPRLSEDENSTLSNHDTSKISSVESQKNITDPSVIVTESLATNYDSADESSACSTSLPSLKKLDTPARDNISSSASKTSSASAGKLKNVKIEDDLPLAIVMKELNEIKLQIRKKKSSYFRNKNTQQYHTGQGKSSSRTRPLRLVIPFPSCIHYGYNDNKSDDCVYHPICKICRSYDHDTHGHNKIISLRRGIKPKAFNMSQRTVKHVVATFIPYLITTTLSGSEKEKLFKLRKLSLTKQDLKECMEITPHTPLKVMDMKSHLTNMVKMIKLITMIKNDHLFQIDELINDDQFDVRIKGYLMLLEFLLLIVEVKTVSEELLLLKNFKGIILITIVVEGVETTIAPATAEEKAQRRALRNQENTNKESTGRTVPVKTSASSTLVSCDRLGGYDWSDQAKDGLTNFALMAYTSTSSNSEVYLKEVAVTELRRKLELAHKQKDEIQQTVDNFKNSSKSLSKLLDCQIVNKCKTGLGYNDVPPPYIEKFVPPKPDLSGLQEFVNESIVSEPTVKKLVVETSEAKASADKHKDVRKNFGPSLIKDWISDSEDEAESKPKVEKKAFKPSFAKIEFVKSKDKVKSPRKTTFKHVKKPKQHTDKSRGNQRNWNNMMSQRLRNYEEINRGYFPFRGNPKGEKITGRGTIRTVPRKNNMYSVDLKNNVPKGGLIRLFAKATSDESELEHRRLGHLNFKTLNKLVKGNLTDDELTEKELKQIEADDQAIQTILLGLPKDIYAAEKIAKLFNEWKKFTSNEGESIESSYHHFLKLMNDLKRNKHFPEKIASNLKFLNNLQPEWSRHVTIVHQIKDLHTADYTQLYDFLKYNQKEIDELKAERLVKTQDPLALMANSNNPYAFPAPHQDQPSSNQNYMQQPMLNPKDITYPTTAINIALVLMAKAFKLNYSTPTNNNQRISSNPHSRQIAQPGMNMGQDRQIQMVGGNGENQFRQYAGQNVGNLNGYNAVQNIRNQVAQNPRVQNVGNQNGLIGVPVNANQNLQGNGNLVAVRAEGNASGQNGNPIRCYNYRGVGHFARNCTVRPRRKDAAYLQTQLLIAQKEEAGIQLQAGEFDLMAAAADLDEMEEVNANCILMANLQQASTLGTQTDKALVYDSDGSAEVHDYENCDDNEIFNMFTQEEHTELLEPIPEQHQVPHNDNNVISEVISVKQSGETVEQHPANFEESHLKKQLSKEKSTVSFLLEEKKKLTSDFKTRKDELLDKQIQLEKKIKELNNILEATKFVGDFKSLAKEVDASLAKHKALELEIERLLRAVVSQDIMSVVQNNSVVDTSNLQTELERTKERFENCIIKKENEYTKLWNDRYKKYLKLLINFVWKFMGTVLFRNDHVAAILGQLCDSDLEVAFRRCACFVRNLEGVDLLKGDRSINLYTINLHEMASASPTCLMARASSTKSWLWHQRLSHLNFDTINDLARNDLVSGLPKFKYLTKHLCPSCEQGKIKRASHPPKLVRNSRQRLHLLHMDLCRPMRISSINGKRKPDISFLHVFGALCYPKNDREDIRKLGAKGNIGFFIGYSADSCAYKIYKQRTKKIIETMNVSFDELSAMAFEQRNSKPRLQSMTSRQISSGLDLTYAPSTITTQQPSEGELDLLFEAMYDDYIGGQPLATARTVLAAQEPQDVDKINPQQQHVQQQGNQANLQSTPVADNVPNALFDGNTFVNPFAIPSH